MSNELVDILGGTHIAASQNQKEATANAGLDRIVASMNKTLSIVGAAGTTTVSAANFGSYFAFRVTGSVPGSPSCALSVPNVQRSFAVINAMVAGNVSVHNGTDPLVAVVQPGYSAVLVNLPGVGVYALTTSVSSGGSGNLPDHTGVPSNYVLGLAGSPTQPAWVAPSGGGYTLVDYAQATRTSGAVALDQTAITSVDTGLDLVLEDVQAGDVVEFGINGTVANEAHTVGFDVYSMVGGSRVNPFGGGLTASLSSNAGVGAWYCPGVAQYFQLGASAYKSLVSGDIDSGDVTLRLHYAKSNSSSRTLFGAATLPLQVWAKAWRAP